MLLLEYFSSLILKDKWHIPGSVLPWMKAVKGRYGRAINICSLMIRMSITWSSLEPIWNCQALDTVLIQRKKSVYSLCSQTGQWVSEHLFRLPVAISIPASFGFGRITEISVGNAHFRICALVPEQCQMSPLEPRVAQKISAKSCSKDFILFYLLYNKHIFGSWSWSVL